ncbi:MAG: ribonuclease P protein component [Minisyncoccia bacterium]
MLPRKLRLSRATFPSPRSGSKATSEHFSLVFGPATAGGCAAVVSKKVARRSVDRHLLKRRMLSVARPFVGLNRYLVLYARAGSPSLSFKTLASELTSLLQSARTRT